MKQLIYDSKVNLVENHFKLNSAVQRQERQTLLNKYNVVNNFETINNGSITLFINDTTFKSLTMNDNNNLNSNYAIVDITSVHPFYIYYEIDIDYSIPEIITYSHHLYDPNLYFYNPQYPIKKIITDDRSYPIYHVITKTYKYFQKTSSFSYRNSENTIKNIKVLNGFLNIDTSLIDIYSELSMQQLDNPDTLVDLNFISSNSFDDQNVCLDYFLVTKFDYIS